MLRCETMTKVCAKCLIEKPFSDFHKKSESKDGLNSWCKACKNAYEKLPRVVQRKKVTTAAWRKREPLKNRLSVQRWQAQHPDKVRQYNNISRSRQARKYTPKQRARRLAVAAHGSASQYQCVRCNSRAEHWHHWSYEPEFWTSVIPVCSTCHKAHHRKQLAIPLSASDVKRLREMVISPGS